MRVGLVDGRGFLVAFLLLAATAALGPTWIQFSTHNATSTSHAPFGRIACSIDSTREEEGS
eukprot:4504049-Amphidinium_carterae.1